MSICTSAHLPSLSSSQSQLAVFLNHCSVMEIDTMYSEQTFPGSLVPGGRHHGRSASRNARALCVLLLSCAGSRGLLPGSLFQKRRAVPLGLSSSKIITCCLCIWMAASSFRSSWVCTLSCSLLDTTPQSSPVNVLEMWEITDFFFSWITCSLVFAVVVLFSSSGTPRPA